MKTYVSITFLLILFGSNGETVIRVLLVTFISQVFILLRYCLANCILAHDRVLQGNVKITVVIPRKILQQIKNNKNILYELNLLRANRQKVRLKKRILKLIPA